MLYLLEELVTEQLLLIMQLTLHFSEVFEVISLEQPSLFIFAS